MLAGINRLNFGAMVYQASRDHSGLWNVAWVGGYMVEKIYSSYGCIPCQAKNIGWPERSAYYGHR